VSRAPLVLVGASGLAREVMDAVSEQGLYQVQALLDDDHRLWGTSVRGVPVSGPPEDIGNFDTAQLLLCAGHGRARSQLARRLAAVGVGDARYARMVHPRSSLGQSVRLAEGSIVLAGSVMTADVDLGRHVVVMPNAVLTHDDVVADYATVCASVLLAGGVRVKEGAYLGAGSSVRQGCTVGAWATLGMAAVALHDIPGGETWIGNPARELVREHSARAGGLG
jgi:sugar O-acyltransferase (sialic acid O-acetyltransferase NeuD family)